MQGGDLRRRVPLSYLCLAQNQMVLTLFILTLSYSSLPFYL